MEFLYVELVLGLNPVSSSEKAAVLLKQLCSDGTRAGV